MAQSIIFPFPPSYTAASLESVIRRLGSLSPRLKRTPTHVFLDLSGTNWIDLSEALLLPVIVDHLIKEYRSPVTVLRPDPTGVQDRELQTRLVRVCAFLDRWKIGELFSRATGFFAESPLLRGDFAGDIRRLCDQHPDRTFSASSDTLALLEAAKVATAEQWGQFEHTLREKGRIRRMLEETVGLDEETASIFCEQTAQLVQNVHQHARAAVGAVSARTVPEARYPYSPPPWEAPFWAGSWKGRKDPLIELSVVDGGVGIVDSLRQWAKSTKHRLPDDDTELLREVFLRGLSSRDQPGRHGRGLPYVFRKVQELGGMLQLRTGRFRLCYPGKDSLEPEIGDMQKSFPGVQYKLLLPVSSRRPSHNLHRGNNAKIRRNEDAGRNVYKIPLKVPLRKSSELPAGRRADFLRSFLAGEVDKAPTDKVIALDCLEAWWSQDAFSALFLELPTLLRNRPILAVNVGPHFGEPLHASEFARELQDQKVPFLCLDLAGDPHWIGLSISQEAQAPVESALTRILNDYQVAEQEIWKRLDGEGHNILKQYLSSRGALVQLTDGLSGRHFASRLPAPIPSVLFDEFESQVLNRALSVGHYETPRRRWHMDRFIELGSACQHMAILSKLSQKISEQLRAETLPQYRQKSLKVLTCARGESELWLSVAKDLDGQIVRLRSYIDLRPFEGDYDVEPGDEVVIGLGVLSSAQTPERLIEYIRERHAKPMGVHSVFNTTGYGLSDVAGIPVHYLYTYPISKVPPDTCPSCNNGEPVIFLNAATLAPESSPRPPGCHPPSDDDQLASQADIPPFPLHDLLSVLSQTDALYPIGHHTWRGRHSDTYIDFSRLLGNPHLRRDIADRIRNAYQGKSVSTVLFPRTYLSLDLLVHEVISRWRDAPRVVPVVLDDFGTPRKPSETTLADLRGPLLIIDDGCATGRMFDQLRAFVAEANRGCPEPYKPYYCVILNRLDPIAEDRVRAHSAFSYFFKVPIPVFPEPCWLCEERHTALHGPGGSPPFQAFVAQLHSRLDPRETGVSLPVEASAPQVRLGEPNQTPSIEEFCSRQPLSPDLLQFFVRCKWGELLDDKPHSKGDRTFYLAALLSPSLPPDLLVSLVEAFSLCEGAISPESPEEILQWRRQVVEILHDLLRHSSQPPVLAAALRHFRIRNALRTDWLENTLGVLRTDCLADRQQIRLYGEVVLALRVLTTRTQRECPSPRDEIWNHAVPPRSEDLIQNLRQDVTGQDNPFAPQFTVPILRDLASDFASIVHLFFDRRKLLWQLAEVPAEARGDVLRPAQSVWKRWRKQLVGIPPSAVALQVQAITFTLDDLAAAVAIGPVSEPVLDPLLSRLDTEVSCLREQLRRLADQEGLRDIIGVIVDAVDTAKTQWQSVIARHGIRLERGTLAGPLPEGPFLMQRDHLWTIVLELVSNSILHAFEDSSHRPSDPTVSVSIHQTGSCDVLIQVEDNGFFPDGISPKRGLTEVQEILGRYRMELNLRRSSSGTQAYFFVRPAGKDL